MKYPAQKKGKVVSFRLWHPYSYKLTEQASAARMRESEYARLATMLVSDMGLFEMNDRMKRVEDQLIRLRKDLAGDVEE